MPFLVNVVDIVSSSHSRHVGENTCIVRGSISMPKLTVDTNSLLCFSCQSAMDN